MGTPAFVGIDVAARRFDVAVLDAARRPLPFPTVFSEIEALADTLARELPSCQIAIDAPQRTCEGLLADPAYRETVTPPPPEGRYRNARECDYQLTRRRLPPYLVPSSYAECAPWMQTGFRLYDALLRTGRWTLFDGVPGPNRLLEVYPFAAFSVLLGAIPPPKYRPEGRAARRQALRAALGWSDAEALSDSHHALDALAAAYTAWAFEAGQGAWVGNPREGLMLLPAPPLERYRGNVFPPGTPDA
jgi:predicted nuclease with RNAse H fold